MMTRYAIVAGRIRAELPSLALLVNRAEALLPGPGIIRKTRITTWPPLPWTCTVFTLV